MDGARSLSAGMLMIFVLAMVPVAQADPIIPNGDACMAAMTAAGVDPEDYECYPNLDVGGSDGVGGDCGGDIDFACRKPVAGGYWTCVYWTPGGAWNCL